MSAATGSEDTCLSITDILDIVTAGEIRMNFIPHLVSCKDCRNKMSEAGQWFIRHRFISPTPVTQDEMAGVSAEEQAILDAMR